MSRYIRVHDQGGTPSPTRERNRRKGALPSVTSPFEAQEEIDEAAESQSGSRSRKSLPKPLRFFPKIFPVPTTLYGIITLIAAGLVLVAFFSSVREVLSPILLVITAGVLLFPFRREPKVRPLLVAAIIVFLAWFIATTMKVLFPFFLAFLFAYIADPLVSYIQRRWYISRWITALTITLLGVAAVAVSIGFVIPVMIAQLGTAYASINKVTTALIDWAHSGSLSALTGMPQQKINEIINTYVLPRLKSIDGTIFSMAGSAGRAAPDILSTIMNLVMVPFIMFYFIKDYWRIRTALYSFLPKEYQRRSQRFLRDLDEVAGGFLRGDLITSLFQGTFIGIGLSIIGVPGALLLGVLMGFLSLIPFLGGYISFAISAVAALGTDQPGLMLLYVGLLYVAQAILESTVISPQVMGHHTNLHPLLVIFSLFIFDYFLGIIGMLIAIPVTAVVIRFAVRWRDERQAQLEQEKLRADLERNPGHASKNDRAILTDENGLQAAT